MRNYFVLVLGLIGVVIYFLYDNVGSESALVTATAYNSVASQTEGDPSLGAWGDRLEPGMKAIAVSPDLVKRGLTHNTKVKIEGLSGTYRVLDRTHSRWKNRIDIYMGVDVTAAKEWGKKKVNIRW